MEVILNTINNIDESVIRCSFIRGQYRAIVREKVRVRCRVVTGQGRANTYK